MKSLLISVVCPTRNRAKYLPTAIRCFLQQTYAHKEMFILDDGEEALEIPNDPRIHYIQFSDRITTGAKRNYGARIANGDIVCNFDDDDFSHAHRLETQLQRLLRTGKAVTGYCATVRFDEASRVLYTGSNCPPYFVSGTSQMYMKAWWDLHPFPSVYHGEDSVFSRTARLADELAAADPGKMMVVRTHAGNTEVINPTRYRKLAPSDISAEFFKAHDAPVKDLAYMTEPHICTATCRNDLQQQVSADVGQDYKITDWPEVQTR